jgi:hypothetical protein
MAKKTSKKKSNKELRLEGAIKSLLVGAIVGFFFGPLGFVVGTGLYAWAYYGR